MQTVFQLRRDQPACGQALLYYVGGFNKALSLGHEQFGHEKLQLRANG